MYAEFLNDAVIDGKVQYIAFRLASDGNSVYASVPAFWTSAEIDPTYSVLVEPNSNTIDTCNNNTNNGKVNNTVLIVSVVVAVVVAVSFAAFFTIRKIRKRRSSRKRLANLLSSANAPPLSDATIELKTRKT